MRELLLLRHAEAMSVGPDGRDTERPLSLHGEAQARAAGAWLAEHGAAPDAVLCSPARRTQMTGDAVGKALRMPRPQFVHAIYRATPGELLALVENHAPDAHQVLLVGHNPGMEELLALLTEGRSAGARGMSPATIAWVELSDDVLEPGRGRLQALWSP
ncbi:MAG TPA: histidine phosphatase family protein [Rhodanobacteraceae bacterium]|nr:histidine phosphatase family protein [Rhodanobacteraceae bacterium]